MRNTPQIRGRFKKIFPLIFIVLRIKSPIFAQNCFKNGNNRDFIDEVPGGRGVYFAHGGAVA